MIALKFKEKFNLPRINEYVASLTKEQEMWFWSLLYEIKQVFTKLDIYHAGSARYGYLGFGKKKPQAKRVEDFLFVIHLKKDKYGNCNFILYITDQAYRSLELDETVLPQGYEEQQIKNEVNFKDWLEEIKKYTIKAGINLEGQSLFPVDYGIEDYFTTLEAYEFLEEKYIKVKEATKKIVGFKNNCGKEMALILENVKPSLFIGSDPESNNQFEFNFIDNNSKIFGKYDENEGRHDGLKTHAPSLYKGHKAYYIEINSLVDLEKFYEWYESEGVYQENMDNKKIRGSEPLNQILYGPPGTGKTYATTALAVQIADPEWYASLTETEVIERHKKIKNKYDELIKAKQIAFTTFHQSFSYEDFMEGLKAYIPEGEKNIAYKVDDGIFKQISMQAQKAESINKSENLGLNDAPKIWKISLGERSDVARRNLYLKNGEIRIGWNEAGDLLGERNAEQIRYFDALGTNDQKCLDDFSKEMKVGDVVLCFRDRKSIQAIGIICSDYTFDEQSYETDSDFAHVRKVKWLVTGINFDILPLNHNYRLGIKCVHELPRISWSQLVEELRSQNIIIKEIHETKELKTASTNHVLIMDEINRGNISKIFGELITLIEDDKRAGKADARELTLPYSKEPFSVPSNLYLIGTMNTADKSLTQLDLALRRRFEFKEIGPDFKILKDLEASQYDVDISEMLKKMNQRIQYLKGKDFQIGHSYFMPLCREMDQDEYLQVLQQIFKNKIIPLLQEYFFNNLKHIALVLNDNPNDENELKIVNDLNLGDSLFGYQQPPKANSLHAVELNRDCFIDLKRFQQIYQ